MTVHTPVSCCTQNTVGDNFLLRLCPPDSVYRKPNICPGLLHGSLPLPHPLRHLQNQLSAHLITTPTTHEKQKAEPQPEICCSPANHTAKKFGAVRELHTWTGSPDPPPPRAKTFYSHPRRPLCPFRSTLVTQARTQSAQPEDTHALKRANTPSLASLPPNTQHIHREHHPRGVHVEILCRS